MLPSQLYRPSLALLTDFYQLTMAFAAWKEGMAGREACFVLSFRRNPFEGGFAVAAGLEHAVDYVTSHRFERDDLDWLGGPGGGDGGPLFGPALLAFLTGGALAGDLSDVFDSVVEGSLGVRFFVGDSASVTARYFFQSFQASTDFSDSEEFSGLAIGVSLFTHHR